MLLPKDWENDNTIAYTLTLAHAECLYLCNIREEALKEFSKLLECPLSLHQRVCFLLLLLLLVVFVCLYCLVLLCLLVNLGSSVPKGNASAIKFCELFRGYQSWLGLLCSSRV